MKRHVFTTITNREFHAALIEDAAEHETNWTINAAARPGDTVLLYVCAPISAIVASATVATKPVRVDDPTNEWFRKYFADMHSLRLLRRPLKRADLRTMFPEWGYWKQPHNSIQVADEYASRLTHEVNSRL